MDANVDKLVSKSGARLRGSGPDSDVVFSSRVRLARNLAGYSFVSRLSGFDREKILASVREAAEKILPSESFWFFDSSSFSGNDAVFLLERQLVSREFVDVKEPRAVLVDKGEDFSVMVLEEDHLRIQGMTAGFDFDTAWRRVNELDDKFERELPYAYDETLGYLTACPSNIGTGIRVSVMLHLPALIQTDEVDRAFRAMQKMKLAVRGMYGEGSKPFGDLFQISNQVTLGVAEEEIISHLQSVVPKLIDYERKARQRLMETEEEQTLDRVFRGIGILKSARKIRVDEAMAYLSYLRLGAFLGAQSDVPVELIDELFLNVQSAHLSKLAGKPLDQEEELRYRADYLRKKLS